MTLREEMFIDVDVHPIVRGSNPNAAPGRQFFDGLRPYLTVAQQHHFETRKSVPYSRYEIPFGAYALDAAPPDDGVPGSDPGFAVTQHLDAHEVPAVVLSSLEASFLTAMPGIDDTIVLSTALNNFLIENWLSVDARFTLAIGVPPRDPLAAANEIRRLGDNPQIVAVFLPTCNIAMGNRYYHPIYDAAQEYGLAIFSHVGSGEGDFHGAATLPGGMPTSFAERRVLFSTVAQANLTSLVFEGAFERFPLLKFAFVEWGFGWVPPLLWAMDARWRALRPDTPWVKRLPSDYVFDHVRFSTQPLDGPDKRNHLKAIFEMVRAERTIMFATDYPHWDNEYPWSVLAGIDPEMRRRILVENALDTFGRLRSRVVLPEQAVAS